MPARARLAGARGTTTDDDVEDVGRAFVPRRRETRERRAEVGGRARGVVRAGRERTRRTTTEVEDGGRTLGLTRGATTNTTGGCHLFHAA
jgi:hypothetical protein